MDVKWKYSDSVLAWLGRDGGNGGERDGRRCGVGGFQKSTSDSLLWLLRSVRLVRSFNAWSFVLVRSVRLFSGVSSLDASFAVSGTTLLVSSQILSGFFVQFLRWSRTDSSVYSICRGLREGDEGYCSFLCTLR